MEYVNWFLDNLPLFATAVTLWATLKFAFEKSIKRHMQELEAKIFPGVSALPIFMKSHKLLLNILEDSGAIKRQDRRELDDLLYEATVSAAEDEVASLKPTGNPVSQAEIDALKRYVNKAKHRQVFTQEEAEEFDRLAKKVEEEPAYRHNVGVLFLGTLAGFILGSLISNNSD